MAWSRHEEFQKYTNRRVNSLGDGLDAGGKAEHGTKDPTQLSLSWVSGLMVGEGSRPEKENTRSPEILPVGQAPKPWPSAGGSHALSIVRHPYSTQWSALLPEQGHQEVTG